MMEQKIEKGIGWLEKLLNLEKKYGFFRFLRVLLLLLITGLIVMVITNPQFVMEKVERLQAEQHAENVVKRVKADADIRMKLHRLIHTLDADRAWLIELHNGAKNLTSGLPFVYGDMRIEEVADGITNVDDEYTDFQLSKYPFIGKVLDTGFFLGSIEDMKQFDERLYFKFKSNNVNEIALFALYSGEDPLGILGVSFCGEKQADRNAATNIISKCGMQISTLLSY